MRTVEQKELSVEFGIVQLKRVGKFWGHNEIRVLKFNRSGQFMDMNYMEELLSMN